jgi:hypothetical protein
VGIPLSPLFAHVRRIQMPRISRQEVNLYLT